MNRVLDRLYIGSTPDLAAPLGSLGFVGVVDLRDGIEDRTYDGVAAFWLGNRDGDVWAPGEVEAAFVFVSDRIQHGPVLIACAAGMSRSASLVIGFLVRCGWSVAEAHERVQAARPKINPVKSMLDCVLNVAVKS